jgi:hypothetical protein
MTTLDALLPECGCCSARGEGPTPIDNRPGLSTLAYRVGTHGRFRAAMLARFPSQPELRALTARSDDDPSVALVDAWSTVLDVLTFYEERIANEGFLRTATERRSVYELAAAIGYQPRPGVAASGPLAFELETAPGAPAHVSIQRGVKVQSVPGQDELPQTFETDETIEARPTWNAIRVQAADRRVPRARDTEAWLEGIATNLRPGDAILFVGRERDESALSENWDMRQVTTVEPDASRGVTRVTWQRGLGYRGPGRWVKPAAEDVRCFAFRQRAALFGAAAPDWASLPLAVRERAARAGAVRADWPGLKLDAIAADQADPDRTIFLDAVYPRVVPGGWIALQRPGYVELYRPAPRLGAAAIADDARTGFTLSAKTTRIVLQGENLNEIFNAHVRDTVVFIDSEELGLAAVPRFDPVDGRTIQVEDPLDGFAVGRTVVVRGPRAHLQVAEGARPTLITAMGSVRLAPRDVVVATAPATIKGTTRTWPVRTAGGDVGTLAGPVGDPDVAPIAAPADAELVAEAKVVDLISPVAGQPGRATMQFAEPLTIAFDRATTVVLANVAQSTHGDTKGEVLGGGDGSRAFQAFTLKQKPLTFVPAPTTGGAASTLEVEVDSVAWAPAPGLDELGPRDRRYVARIADDGSATIEFGDGHFGARLPSGVENVQASYRVGIGAVGNVAAGQLSLLMTRPLGTRSVTNPLPASGGADPESRDAARVNAPLTVQTFDRVVTLDDCANLARSFAGIGKSEARWIWEGRRRVILLTIAGVDGAAVAAIPTIRNLAAEIRDKSDGHLAVRILACELRTFDLEAGVFLVDGYDETRVLAEVRARLLATFSFARRGLAQRVSVSEAGAAIQAVPGVLAVDLDADGIWFTGEARPTAPVLRSLPGRPGPDGPLPAQLVTISRAPNGIVLGRRR